LGSDSLKEKRGMERAVMAGQGRLGEWASSVVSNSEQRQQRLRRANRVEIVGTTLSAVCAFLAVWGFTSSSTVLDGIRSEAVGGVSVLCFTALMFLAAGAGIEKRLIALVSELETRGEEPTPAMTRSHGLLE
jgi:hypothetical protein